MTIGRLHLFFPAIDHVPTEFKVDWSEEESRYAVLTPVAVSEDERRRVAIITALYPFEMDGTNFRELKFAIAAHDVETDEVFESCDRDMAKRSFIKKPSFLS